MSSDYLLICMAHEPALLDAYGDHGSLEGALAAVAASVEHANCPIVIARYSGALVELICPPMGDRHNLPEHSGWHRDADRVEAAWLRLMLLAGRGTATKARVPGCWSYERVYRLRHLLGVEEAPTS